MNEANVKDIKLITIDGDGCLFSYENVGSAFHSSWDALGFAYGLKETWDGLIKKYYKKNASDEDNKKWAEEEAADLRGRKVEDCFKVLYPVPYCLGAKIFAEATQGKIKRGVLSTGIDLVVHRVCEELGFDFGYCNVLHHNAGIFDGSVSYLVPTWGKSKIIPDICGEFHVEPHEICHIGDNENDLPVAERVGMFIALNPKNEEVRRAAKFIAYSFHDVMGALAVA